MAAASPYRELQRRCKELGLPANRKASELEQLLAGHAGGSPAPAPVASQEKPGPSEPAAASGASYDGGISLWPDGLAGVSAKGIFNALPAWVDGSKPPGMTSLVELLGVRTTALNIATLRHFIWSPNLTWWVAGRRAHHGGEAENE